MQRAQQCVLRALEKFSECEQGETKAILVKKKKKKLITGPIWTLPVFLQP